MHRSCLINYVQIVWLVCTQNKTKQLSIGQITVLVYRQTGCMIMTAVYPLWSRYFLLMEMNWIESNWGRTKVFYIHKLYLHNLCRYSLRSGWYFASLGRRLHCCILLFGFLFQCQSSHCHTDLEEDLCKNGSLHGVQSHKLQNTGSKYSSQSSHHL